MYRITLTKDSPTPTTEDPIELFLQDQDIKPNSKDIYRREIRQYFEYLNKREILEPTKQTIQEYKQHLIDSGKAAITVSAYLIAIKSMYKWFDKHDICTDITDGVKLLRRPVGFRKDALTVEQAKELLLSFDTTTEQGSRDYSLVNTMVRTGARSIELQRANIQDIQQVGNDWVIFIQGKGLDSKEELLVLSKESLEPIRNYLALRPEVKGADPLFASISDRNDGDRLCTRSISRICKTALRRIVNSKRISAHSLRHTAVTLALLGGSSLQEVQAMARHRDIKITQIYAHNIDRIKQAPEYSIDAILGKVA